MNELMELERDLGPHLRRALDTIIPTEGSEFADQPPPAAALEVSEFDKTVTVGIEDRWIATTSRGLRLVGVAAAITVIVAGGFVALSHRDRSATNGSTDTSTPLDSIATTLLPLPDTVNPPGVYLPTVALPGFSLADISVDRPTLDRPRASVEHSTVRYVRHGADGVSVAAMITLTGARTTTVDNFDGKQPPLVVHGKPAHIYDSGFGIVSSWQEDGVDASVTGFGVSWDNVAALAEQTVVDPSTLGVRLPTQALEGFELSMADTSPPEGAVTTSLHYVADDPRPGAFVDVASSLNDELMTVDSIELSFKLSLFKIDRGVVHKLPAVVATSAAGEFGPLIAVSWIEDGYQFTVTGRADKGKLIAFAEGLAPSNLEQARQLKATIDTARFALPEVDRVTLPNGFDVSIRTTGTGANVICMHAPVQRCQLYVTEGSLAGDFQREIIATFWINDTAWFLGWTYGTHSPHVFAGGDVGDAVANTAQGTAGTYFAVQLTDPGAQVVFDPGDPTTIYGAPGSGTNTDVLN